jgi:hypothetical protein
LNLDHAELFAILGLAGIGALWKAATLRGDTREKWAPRVADAEAGMADRATTEAISMQREIAEVIGSSPGALPRLATFDAAPLAKRAAEFQKTLTVGSRVPSDFRWLLRLGPLAILIAVAFLLGLAAVFVDNSELLTSAVLRVGGLIVGMTAVGLGVLLVAGYVVLNQRLSGAEIRAGEELE